MSNTTSKTFDSSSMKKILIPGLIFLLLCICGICGLIFFMADNDEINMGTSEFRREKLPIMVETENWGNIPVNELYIMLKDEYGKKEAMEIAQNIGGNVIGVFDYISLYYLEVPSTNEEELNNLMTELRQDSRIEAVTPDIEMTEKRIDGIPCAIMNSETYSVNNNSVVYDAIGLQTAWDYVNASKVELNKVRVGVVDDGLLPEDEDVSGNKMVRVLEEDDVNYVPDTYENGSLAMGGKNHGTGVTNVIAGRWENGGIVGVAAGLGDNLDVTVTNAFDEESFEIDSTNPEEIDETLWIGKYPRVFGSLTSFKKQIKAGAKIINYSVGPDHPSVFNKEYTKVMKKFLERMKKEHPDVLFVVAAGNEGRKNTPLDGTNYGLGGLSMPNLITVGALNKNGDRAEFSNYTEGKGEITLSVVGEGVPLFNANDGSIHTDNGTSFAAPQVTAAAAVLRSINPNLNAEQIKKLLVENADTTTSIGGVTKPVDSKVGGKIMRLDKAVLKVINQVRKDNHLPEVTEDELKSKTQITAWADETDDSLIYRVNAEIRGVDKDGTEIKAEMSGYGGMGNSTQLLSADGTMWWDITLAGPEQGTIVTITRLDSNACSRVHILGKKIELEPSTTPTEISKPTPTKTITLVAKPTPTKVPPIPTPTPIPVATPTPLPTPLPVGSPYQVVSDCNLCWNGNMSCACGSSACRCCPNNDDNCNAFDL